MPQPAITSPHSGLLSGRALSRSISSLSWAREYLQEENIVAMLDVGYTQDEVNGYQAIGYQMTWAKWWKFVHQQENSEGDDPFNLDDLKLFSQKEARPVQHLELQGLVPGVLVLHQLDHQPAGSGGAGPG